MYKDHKVRSEQTLQKLGTIITMLAVFFSSAVFAQAAEPASDSEIVVEPAPLLSDTELHTLVGPIALYPDDLLAIVLPASTYPLQVVAAARFRADEANDNQEPDADWDESIVALLNYPEALALLNDDIDWTWELGQAVTDQEQDLMRAVQAVRKEAYAAGNIDSDDKQTVYVEDDAVVIEPADEEVVYVPYYEPEEVVRQQTTRVYHYYPTAYPVYYYPYHSSHYFYDHGFWGISSFFSLSWGYYHLNHYGHNHHHHRYFGRRYYNDHYRFTRHYVSIPVYRQRWAHRRAYDYAYNGHWRPKHRYYGARPNYRKYNRRHDGYRDRADRRIERKRHRRHVERRGQHHYASIRQNRSAFRPVEGRRAERRSERLEQGVRGINQRHSAHRDIARERHAVQRSDRQRTQRNSQPRNSQPRKKDYFAAKSRPGDADGRWGAVERAVRDQRRQQQKRTARNEGQRNITRATQGQRTARERPQRTTGQRVERQQRRAVQTPRQARDARANRNDREIRRSRDVRRSNERAAPRRAIKQNSPQRVARASHRPAPNRQAAPRMDRVRSNHSRPARNQGQARQSNRGQRNYGQSRQRQSNHANARSDSRVNFGQRAQNRHNR